ncbi:MAG TPA: cation diffusion facilitator family transporter [Gemmata sp.]|nr:cation diffusion facilitator family transporter [Gemmata sp.]
MPSSPPIAQLRGPIVLSILAAILTIALKGVASAITGSVGLLSDALESVVNLFTAITAFVALGYAARPADKTHAFGHEKIEYFSSGLEGILIIVAGLAAAGYAIRRLVQPQPLDHLEIGTVLGLIAAAVNLIVGRILLVKGRKFRSIVLEADGKHLMADVWTTMGIVAGLVLVLFTGLSWLDPVLAIVIGINISWTGGELVVKSFNGLMDHALSTQEEEQIRSVILATLPANAAFHLLRTRLAGTRRFAEFHLLVDGEWTVRTAHHLAHKVEAALTKSVPGLEVTIHIEPVDERDSWESEELRQLEEMTAARQVQQPKQE